MTSTSMLKLSLLLVAPLTFSACRSKSAADSLPPPTHIVAESRRLTTSVAAFGSIQSASSSVIRAPSGGKVAAIHVERGKYINKGDSLLEVSNDRYIRQRDEQAGKVKSCEWALKKKELERDGKEGRDRDIAAAEVEIARVELESARRKLEAAIEDLTNCHVKAPFGGTIMAVDVKVGDLVTASGEYSLGSPLFQVVGSSDYVIEVSLGEVETARIDPNCRVEVRLPAVFGETFEGKIKSISQAGRRSERGPVFPVTIAFSTDDPRIKLGLSAELRFVLNTKETATAVPLSIVRFDDKGPWLAVEGVGKREQRYVKLGVNDSSFVEVISGISPSDRILE